MLIVKASLKFKNLKPGEKVGFGDNVITQLNVAAGSTENPFPDLPVSIKNLTTLNVALKNAFGAMNQGGKTAHQVLKEAGTAWNNAFTAVANYVTMVANGTGSVITEAGYNVTKTSRSKKPLAGGIKGFSATVNHSKGAVTVRAANASDYADGYLFAAIPEGVSVTFNGDVMVINAGGSNIYIAASSKRQIDLAALPKAKAYNFTMAAFNAAGTGAAAPFQEVIPQ